RLLRRLSVSRIASLPFSLFLLLSFLHFRALPSFPTRRSSDLSICSHDSCSSSGVVCIYVTCCNTTKRSCVWIRLFTNSRYGKSRFFSKYRWYSACHTVYLFLVPCCLGN